MNLNNNWSKTGNSIDELRAVLSALDTETHLLSVRCEMASNITFFVPSGSERMVYKMTPDVTRLVDGAHPLWYKGAPNIPRMIFLGKNAEDMIMSVPLAKQQRKEFNADSLEFAVSDSAATINTWYARLGIQGFDDATPPYQPLFLAWGTHWKLSGSFLKLLYRTDPLDHDARKIFGFYGRKYKIVPHTYVLTLLDCAAKGRKVLNCGWTVSHFETRVETELDAQGTRLKLSIVTSDTSGSDGSGGSPFRTVIHARYNDDWLYIGEQTIGHDGAVDADFSALCINAGRLLNSATKLVQKLSCETLDSEKLFRLQRGVEKALAHDLGKTRLAIVHKKWPDKNAENATAETLKFLLEMSGWLSEETIPLTEAMKERIDKVVGESIQQVF